MTDPDLPALIAQYRSGLEAELALLRGLEHVAVTQRGASADRDFDALNRAADHRDRLMTGLVNLEEELRAVRSVLTGHREEAQHLAGYQAAAALHRQAAASVERILESDAQSLAALASAELARRDAARAMEQGETTLSAYRKVMTLAPGATLVNRHG